MAIKQEFIDEDQPQTWKASERTNPNDSSLVDEYNNLGQYMGTHKKVDPTQVDKNWLNVAVGSLAGLALPGIGQAIGNSLFAESVAAGTMSATTATAAGTAIASAGLQVAQGVPIEDAIRNAAVSSIVQTNSMDVAKAVNAAVKIPEVSNMITSVGTSVVSTALKGGSEKDMLNNAVGAVVGSGLTSVGADKIVAQTLGTLAATKDPLAAAAAAAGVYGKKDTGTSSESDFLSQLSPEEQEIYKEKGEAGLKEYSKQQAAAAGQQEPTSTTTPEVVVQAPSETPTPTVLDLVKQDIGKVEPAGGPAAIPAMPSVDIAAPKKEPSAPTVIDQTSTTAPASPAAPAAPAVPEVIVTAPKEPSIIDVVQQDIARTETPEVKPVVPELPPVEVTAPKEGVPEMTVTAPKEPTVIDDMVITAPREDVPEMTITAPKEPTVIDEMTITAPREDVPEMVITAPKEPTVIDETVSSEEEPETEEQPYKPEVFTFSNIGPKKKSSSSTLSQTLQAPFYGTTTGLTSSRGAGEIEVEETGKPRKNVWNEASLRLKDALGL